MDRRLAVAVVMVSCVSVVFGQEGSAPPEESSPATVEGADVKGRPEQDVVKVASARYFVWKDGQGWHLRTAAKARTMFSGSIKLENGSFIKLRPIGLDPKAKSPDRWGVNEDRTEIRFELYTVGSFDGFDFDVLRAGGEPKVVFDLKQGMNGQRRPKRIFLGSDSKNPTGAHFTCPADPDANRPKAQEEK